MIDIPSDGAYQGDLGIFPVPAPPPGLVEVPPSAEGHVVARRLVETTPGRPLGHDAIHLTGRSGHSRAQRVTPRYTQDRIDAAAYAAERPDDPHATAEYLWTVRDLRLRSTTDRKRK